MFKGVGFGVTGRSLGLGSGLMVKGLALMTSSSKGHSLELQVFISQGAYKLSKGVRAYKGVPLKYPLVVEGPQIRGSTF